MQSLSEQLRRLRAPQTLVFKGDSQRHSLLFDKSDAAGYTSDEIFAIGKHGLDDLLQLDDGFSEFQNTLFGEASLTVERSIVSKQENQKLNRTIETFLLRLTPYLPLTSAHQALEWLIFKYRINHYNVDELLKSALPHHDSGIFVKLLQICWTPDSNGTIWYWLSALRKTGTPLSRQHLLNHCISNLNFLQVICDTTICARELLDDEGRSMQLIYSFYTSIICGTLATCSKVTNKIVGLLLPYVGEGLKSKDASFIISSSMIICQLATKCILAKDACEALLSQLLLALINEDIAASVLPTAAVLCQTQPIAGLTLKSMKKIAKRLDKSNAWQVLSKLDQRYDLNGLLRVILCALVDKMATVDTSKRNIYENAIRKILDNVNLERNVAVQVLRYIFSCSNNIQDENERSTIETGFEGIAVLLGEQLRQRVIISNENMKTSEKEKKKCRIEETKKKRAVMREERLPIPVDEDMNESPIKLEFEDVTSDFFQKLSSPKRQKQFDELVNSLRASERGRAVGARQALHRIRPPASFVAGKIRAIVSSTETGSPTKKKRRLTGDNPSAPTAEPALDSMSMTRISDLLEMFLENKQVGGASVMTSQLFTFLNGCLHADDQDVGNYAMQLCLSALVEIFKDSRVSGVKASDLNVDSLVECIRSTQSPRVHQHAFQLLSVAAVLFKEDLVIRLMPIFSFMGRGLLRQDDSYTFEVIHRALENVIPSVLQASRNPMATLLTVFRDFVVSVPYIPEHRRLSVLKKLVGVASWCDVVRKASSVLVKDKPETVSCDCLWILVGIMLEYHITNWEKPTDEKEPVSSFVEFTVRLCSEFPPSDQLFCLVMLLRYVYQLPDEMGPLAVSSFGQYPNVFEPAAHTNKQLRHFKYESVSYANRVLSSSGFITKLVSAAGHTSMPDDLTTLFQWTVEILLSRFEKEPITKTGEESDAIRRYWRMFLGKAKSCLEQIGALLPASVSLSIIGGILTRDSIQIRRHALDLLNAKLLQNPTPFTKDHVGQLVDMAQQLTSWLVVQPENQAEIVFAQCLLFTLKLLVRIVSAFTADAFNETLQRVVEIVSMWRQCNRLYLSNAALCLAELVQCMGTSALELLPRFGKDVVAILDDQTVWTDNNLVLISALTAAQKIVENLADFFGPYLADFLKAVAKISRCAELITGQFKSQFRHRMANIQKTVASMPSRVLLQPMEGAFDSLGQSPLDLPYIFTILNTHIKGCSSSDVSALLPQFIALFLASLDLRTTSSDISVEEMDSVEGECMDAFSSLALKLSENDFRPIIFKLVEWARVEENCGDRLITFFRLTSKLYDTFRSLFNLFSAQVIKLAAEVLKKENSLFTGKHAQAKSKTLVFNVLATIKKCCQFDSHGFISRDRFDMLTEALVEKVITCSTDPDLLSELSQGITFATIAVKDDSAWKTLNYQILMKTRHQLATVRLSALKILDHLYAQLGSESSTLVAETVPFLAELIEDDNEDVELQCQKVISTLESIVGDSLREYF